jgi:formamidopyrimidine-DNA glycosylase
MPELPDVENFKRYLDANALNQKIGGVRVLNARILRDVTERTLRKALTGHRLTSTRRHGKHLLVRIDKASWLTLHFGMSGRLIYFEHPEDDPRHDRFRLDFENGHHLAYDCRRMLGGIGLAEDADAFIAAHNLGPDALDPRLTEEAFIEALAGKRGQIKSVLMNQELLAGIGNFYSDEILFQARLHPKADLGDLDDKQRGKLYRTMREVLGTAVEAGAGSEEFADRLPRGYLLPHRRKGGTCPRCHGAIRTMKAAGRTAYYCPHCQPG